jgi:hypothetical protein
MGGFVALPCHHQLPGDPGDLVGQRHCNQLGRLALEQIHQPGRSRRTLAAPQLPDDSRGPGHQHTAQDLVPGARDNPMPHFASGGMILRGQAEPGGKVAGGSEGLRGGRLHHQHRSANRPHPRNPSQAPAAFMGAVPSHEAIFNLLPLGLQPRIFHGVHLKQLSGQSRQGLLGFGPLQQRLDPAQPGRGNEPKLRRIAADHVDQLGALADQPIAHTNQHQGSLLLHRFDQYKAHGRPAHGLAQGLRVGRVVLAALDIRLGQLWRDQLYFVP